jgi:hypothetical protein
MPPTEDLHDAVMGAFTTGYRANLTGHTKDVPSLAHAPDRPLIATISWDRTVRLWDVSDVHHPKVRSTIVLNGEGTAHQDGEVRLWNDELHQLKEIEAHAEALWSRSARTAPSSPRAVTRPRSCGGWPI